MIYEVEGGRYVISSGHSWLPGSYASRRAARYAFQFSNEELQALQDQVNVHYTDPNLRVISFEMLQARKKSRSASL